MAQQGGQRAPLRRGDIEGLRGIAVLAVVAYHAGLISGGYVGVDVFFVISGYLITQLLWRELRDTGRLSFATFYARRARRLLPMAATVLVLTLLASRVWLPPLQTREVAKDAGSAALYVANYRFLALRTDYLSTSAPSPFQHFWSLAVEEQFYALWPLLLFGLLLGLQRLRGTLRVEARVLATTIAAIGAFSFLLSLHLTHTSQPWAFFSLPTRAWELLAGAVLALATDRVQLPSKHAAAAVGWCGVAAIAWASLRFDASTAFPGTAAIVPVAGATAVLLAGLTAPRRGASLALAGAPMQRLGRISYSWYLWHWPVLVIAPIALGHALSRPEAVFFAAASGLLAWASTAVVENPVRFAPLLAAQPRRSIALGAALTAMSLIVAVATVNSLPSLTGGQRVAALQLHLSRSDVDPSATHTAAQGRTAAVPPSALEVAERAVVQQVTHGVQTKAVPSNLEPPLGDAHGSKAQPFLDGCDNTFTDSTVHECAYGITQSSTTIVLFGDSHAAQWYPPLHALALLRHWRLVNLTKATCPPMVISVFSPILGHEFHECDAWRQAAFARIAQEHPAVVVVGVARHYGPEYHFPGVYSPEWINGLGDVVHRLTVPGTSVVVMGPTPKAPTDMPDCVSAHVSDVNACTFARTSGVDGAGEQSERNAVLGAGGHYLDVPSMICTNETCAAIVGNLLVYRDDNHLTKEYAEWLAPVLSAAIDQAWPHGRPR